MSKHTKAPARLHKSKSALPQTHAVTLALLQRVDQRTAATGALTIPAVPALLDFYVELCASVFAAVGRRFTAAEGEQAKAVIEDRLLEAFDKSPRSKVVIQFEAEPGRTLGYEVQAKISSVADAYERWIGTSDQPLFGTHADARIWSLAEQFKDPTVNPLLDLGAGTGRNAFALARRGHPVDAVEITPKFADMLSATAAHDDLSVRVVACDVLHDASALRRDYSMLFASEVVPDFRDVSDLRRLFALANEVLVVDGLLIFNVHLAAQGYTPDRAAREFAQQCYSALFTPSDVAEAAEGLSFELVSNDSVHDYEREHLPTEAWPPTPWFINWALGLDVFETDRERCPVELRWLVFRKKPAPPVAESLLAEKHTKARSTTELNTGVSPRPRRFDTADVRKALLRRLKRRWIASGSFTFPAVPGLREHFVTKCLTLFDALGRGYACDQRDQAGQIFERVLREAYVQSPRSNIVVNYEASMGAELHYAVTADAVPLVVAYEDWLERLPPPLFGDYPDARLLALLDQLKSSSKLEVLDLGAGTGRNALYLAERGHSVRAIEMTPKLAELIRGEAQKRQLSVPVETTDLFDALATTDRKYSLLLLIGVVGDFRNTEQLRRFFELAVNRLASGGQLLVSVHLAAHHYVPDVSARQWAEQCCATFFTRDELRACTTGFDLELISDESAYEFESTRLPEHAWPPTPAFVEWATCQHLFALPAERCPVELRWLVYRKSTD